ncbi:MAG: CD1845 family protein [Lachnospiraceae bacterium]
MKLKMLYLCGFRRFANAWNGIILLVIAFLISPLGLSMLMVRVLGLLQDANCALRLVIYFHANFIYNVSTKGMIP